MPPDKNGQHITVKHAYRVLFKGREIDLTLDDVTNLEIMLPQIRKALEEATSDER